MTKTGIITRTEIIKRVTKPVPKPEGVEDEGTRDISLDGGTLI